MPIVRSLGPCYMFQWVTTVNEDSGEERRLFAPVDCNGLFPTREEWSELVRAVSSFYDYLTPTNIEAANEQQRERNWQRQEPTPRSSPPAKRTHPGYVYLLKGGPYYKIGLSNNVTRRIEEISPKLPFETELICTIATEDMYELEAFLHEMFADKRANGEWFELDETDVEHTRGLADE